MFGLASWLKSPLPIACQDGPHLKPTFDPETRPVPSTDQTAVVPSCSPQQAAVAAAVRSRSRRAC